MGAATRRRALTVTADGANNQTAWNTLNAGGMVTITGTITGAVTLQRRDGAGNISDATDDAGTVITYTKIGTYRINPNNVSAEYRLNAKSGAVSAFPFTMAVEAGDVQ